MANIFFKIYFCDQHISYLPIPIVKTGECELSFAIYVYTDTAPKYSLPTFFFCYTIRLKRLPCSSEYSPHVLLIFQDERHG